MYQLHLKGFFKFISKCYVAAWMEGKSGGNWMHLCVYTHIHTYIYIYIYMAESVCYPPETITMLLISYTPMED